MLAVESQLAQSPAHLAGREADAAAEAGDDLAGGDGPYPLVGPRFPVVGEDQLTGRVGGLEAAVPLVDLVDLPLVEPVAVAVVEQRLGLGVDPLIMDRVVPGAVDARHLEDQPPAVAGIVGEEERVVAGGAEGGDVRQVHLVARVGRPLVDVERGGERLELVQLVGAHGVDLLVVDQQVFGDGEEVVFGQPLAVGLRRIVVAEAGGQQVLHEGGLVAPLPSDQDEDHLVDHPLVERAGQHTDEPPLEAVGEPFGLVVDGMDHGGEPADVVGRPVPGGQLVEVVGERMEVGGEIAGEQRAHPEEVRVDPLVLHGAPEGVLDGVVQPAPVVLLFETYLDVRGEQVAPDLEPLVDEALHLPDGGPSLGPVGRLLVVAQPFRAMLVGQGVAAPGGRPDGVGVVVGEGLERPAFRLVVGDAEAVHPVEAAADVVVVAVRHVGDPLLLDQASHRRFGPLGGDPGRFRFPLRRRQGERRRVGAIEGLRVVADHRHPGRVLALAVDPGADELGVVVVDRLPGRRETALAQFLRHPDDHPDPLSGEGDVGEEGVGIGIDLLAGVLEAVVGQVVDVDHDKAGVAGHVRQRPSALERDGGDKGGLILFDPAPVLFQPLDLVRVAVGLQELELPGCGSIEGGCPLVRGSFQLIDQGLPTDPGGGSFGV